MGLRPNLEVCLSPQLLENYKPEGKVVVIIDIFRASSAIVTGIACGIKEIIPVETLDEALDYKKLGYIVAAERNGEVIEGFDFGNSPFSFMDESLVNQTIVLTTTNCTRAIFKAKNANRILVGSFLNIQSIADYLCENVFEDVILLCAGWKNKFNLEDTIYAGALVDRINQKYRKDCDAAVMAQLLYLQSKPDMRGFLTKSSHNQRLEALGIENDIQFCLKEDLYSVIPIFEGSTITALETVYSNKG
jgi:2-phosphosulfolactate phosphatase